MLLSLSDGLALTLVAGAVGFFLFLMLVSKGVVLITFPGSPVGFGVAICPTLAEPVK
jgi:hypothetical protein